MNKPLTYDDIPKMYLFCNHTKCPRRNKCLRFQAAMIVPQSVPHYEAININHVAGNEKECSYFSAYTLTTFALGISHILDDVPHKKAMAIQNSLKSLMGKSMYYRIRNKQRRLHPLEHKAQTFSWNTASRQRLTSTNTLKIMTGKRQIVTGKILAKIFHRN